MLDWKVCYRKGPICKPACHYEKPCHHDVHHREVQHRKRHKRKDWYAPVVIACAVLVSLLVLPAWTIAVLICLVLAAMGIVLFLA